jgi:predicted Rossmann fold nucleotide-binding protein DprA/Smf involved in DNA uptake
MRHTHLAELLSAEGPVHIDDMWNAPALNSSEVLATLFDLEMKGVIPADAGQAVQQSLAVEADRGLPRWPGADIQG